MINLSVNQTLSRTMMTSGLTFLTVLALFLFGGPVLHGFSFALVVVLSLVRIRRCSLPVRSCCSGTITGERREARCLRPREPAGSAKPGSRSSPVTASEEPRQVRLSKLRSARIKTCVYFWTKHLKEKAYMFEQTFVDGTARLISPGRSWFRLRIQILLVADPDHHSADLLRCASKRRS